MFISEVDSCESKVVEHKDCLGLVQGNVVWRIEINLEYIPFYRVLRVDLVILR